MMNNQVYKKNAIKNFLRSTTVKSFSLATSLTLTILGMGTFNQAAQAATFFITSGGGTNETFASGTITDIVNGTSTVVANFTLTQLGKTGYGNHNYFDGSSGIGVDHLAAFGTADDFFSYDLTISPLLAEISQTSITILGANPYQPRNYGPDFSQGQDNTITANWTGGAVGTISNPNGNIGLVDGSTVTSGFTTAWNTGDRVEGDWSFNQVNWNMKVPVESLIYSFSTSGETFAMGAAFDVEFEYDTVPVPEFSSPLSLLFFGMLGLGMVLKSKQ